MDDEIIGPFHYYCKPINSDIIQCILFESTDANARMTEVEYMVSKKLARSIGPIKKTGITINRRSKRNVSPF